ncbi:MAG: hypothetical protein A2X08_05640 [Bacteroidetes bacterium GWA2_32_17]|nr:MAG: hypothetical protein A2X08_05640 [Bacteroidetes bacterium GWA2_32_17]
MKSNNSFRYFLIFAGAGIYQWAFWHETPGLNISIFTAFIVPTLLFLYPESVKKVPFWLVLTGLLSASLAIVVHASLFATIMYVISIILFVGFAHWSQTKSPVFAIPSSIANLVLTPYTFFAFKNYVATNNKKSSVFLKWVKLFVLPVVILIVFFTIFYNASDKFAEYSDKVLFPIQDFIYNLFGNITFASIFFFVHGILLITWILIRNKNTNLSDAEKNQTVNITRNKVRRKRHFQFLGLKREYLSAFILLVLINLLVLAANIVDIVFIWFGFEFKEGMNLKQFVHEGTYLLILSILLSMGILLYIFRKNQNFYSKGKILKVLSFAWIFQNLILAISVGVRNYHYMEYYGLAYKRVGVCIFLILVFFGLITFFIKIMQKKSSYFLLKFNSWAMYLLLIISSLFSWDTIITKYNIKHCKELDYEFLVHMSTKALPFVDINKLSTDLSYKNPWIINSNYNYDYFYVFSMRNYYVKQVFNFLYDWETDKFLSWSYYDKLAYQNFMSNPELVKSYKIYKDYRIKKNQIENGNKNSVQNRTPALHSDESR